MNKSSPTPIMQQYLDIKKRYENAILLFRMGDFYETFYNDAKVVAKEVGITLTAREYRGEKIPMAGVPAKSVDTYIKKLVERGHTIAICEQLEPPGKNKKIVKRDVVEVISPGNVLRPSLIDEKENNFIGAVKEDNGKFIIVIMDVSTGEILYSKVNYEYINDIISRFNPKEIIKPISLNIEFDSNILVVPLKDYVFDDKSEEFIKERINISSLSSVGLEGKKDILSVINALWKYVEHQHNREFTHFYSIKEYSIDDSLQIDASTLRNLEIFSTIRGNREGSLLYSMDKTLTPMGGRFIRKAFTMIPTSIEEITGRLDAVEELINSGKIENVREILRHIGDINRICVRIENNKSHPREIITLKNSLKRVEELKKEISSFDKGWWKKIKDYLSDNTYVVDIIEKSIKEDAPSSVNDGGIIKDGYNKDVDELRYIINSTQEWIKDFQEKEKERTGIPNLRIGFNSVFGYYIEVTKSYINQVPDDYIRKQTLRSAERFITPSLKEMEEKVLSAEEKLTLLENKLFTEIRDKLKEYVVSMKKTGDGVAMVDYVASMSYLAVERNYTKPVMHSGYDLIVENGRHPVVEITTDEFIPNDTYMDEKENIMIITGPNMSGKSTYLRQNAIIVLLAHIGSYVPASYAKIPLTDRIFTRIGASDDISTGVSTFMMEMIETAYILNNATEKSFIILDEVGRGTGTYDGISIARAVVEYISERIKAKTMFATHYLELTEMENIYDNIVNMKVLIKEWNGKIVFLKKVVKGKSDKSYGIEVAELAGIPKDVINRAKEIIEDLTKYTMKEKKRKDDMPKHIQLSLLPVNESKIEKEIMKIDINELKPIEALNLIYQWKKEIGGTE